MEYFTKATLSEAAEALLRFDVDSINHVVAAQRGRAPEIWLVDANAYERDGRVLRDSPSSRLLAYSPTDRVLYANDGCNSCTRRLKASLESFTDSELQTFAEDNDLRLELLERLAEIAR